MSEYSLNISTVVWGDYVDFYLRYALPSILSPKNKKAIDKDAVFTFHTKDEDFEKIRNSDIFKKIPTNHI